MRIALPRFATRRSRWRLAFVVVTSIVAAYAIAYACREPILECTPVGDARPICGLHNPEDLALLSDGRTVIVSQYGLGLELAPGSLALLDLETEAIAVVYPDPEGSESSTGSLPHPGWGEPRCPGPPGRAFSPHGIDLSQRADGPLQLLVVNHGGRESIEFFEVMRGASGWSVAWRGCAVAPDDAFFNAVAGLPEGDLVVTHMMSRSHPLWDTTRAKFGADTGFVYEWRADRGFRPITGTEAPMPNGIVASASGDTFFVNSYASSQILHYDRQSGALLGRADVSSPDNVAWSKDGRLLVASQRGSFADMMECLELVEGSCSMEFAIVAFDPKDWSREVLYQNRGAPMGGATIAIDVGDGLLIGSFASDRVVRVRR